MQVSTSDEEIVPGLLVPRGWRLLAALLAGALWICAIVLLLPLPGELREGVLYRQATGEGLGLLQPIAPLTLAMLALLSAHGFSRKAHGTGPPLLRPVVLFLDEPRGWVQAPRVVRAARLLTWVAFALVVIASSQVAAIDLGPGECFRTCAPYPP